MRATTAIRTLGRKSRLPSLALAAAGCVVTLAACGSSRSTGYHDPHYPYGAPNVPASLSRCMRANGVSGFPDPVAGPTGAVGLPLMVNSDGSLTAAGKTFAGPALRSAEHVCKEYLPPAGGPSPQVGAEQRRQSLAFARCMRTHGVPNFPDPTFSNGPSQLPAAINTNSPAFRSAVRVCGAAGNGNIEISG